MASARSPVQNQQFSLDVSVPFDHKRGEWEVLLQVFSHLRAPQESVLLPECGALSDLLVLEIINGGLRRTWIPAPLNIPV